MHIACYARSGRGNQLVLEFTAEEHLSLQGQLWQVSTAADGTITFDPNDAIGLVVGRQLRINTNYATFGRTQISGSFQHGSFVIPPVPRNRLRSRRRKLVARQSYISRVRSWLRRRAA